MFWSKMQISNTDEMFEHEASGESWAAVWLQLTPLHGDWQKWSLAMLLGRTAEGRIHMIRRAPSRSTTHISILLELVCSSVQFEMGMNKKDLVVKSPLGSYLSHIWELQKLGEITAVPKDSSRFRWNIRKKFLTMRVLRHWNKMPRKAVGAPILFTARLVGALRNLVWWKVSQPTAMGLEPDDLWSPF